MIAECGCPDPFVRRREYQKSSLGDCFETGRGNTALATRKSGYRLLSRADLDLAQRVLEAFDVVIPTSRFNHTLVSPFILWKAGWFDPFDDTPQCFFKLGHEHSSAGVNHGSARRRDTASKFSGQNSTNSGQRTTDGLQEGLTVPPCILATLRKQNRMEAELYSWALARFDDQIEAFASILSQAKWGVPKWACDGESTLVTSS